MPVGSVFASQLMSTQSDHNGSANGALLAQRHALEDSGPLAQRHCLHRSPAKAQHICPSPNSSQERIEVSGVVRLPIDPTACRWRRSLECATFQRVGRVVSTHCHKRPLLRGQGDLSQGCGQRQDPKKYRVDFHCKPLRTCLQRCSRSGRQGCSLGRPLSTPLDSTSRAVCGREKTR